MHVLLTYIGPPAGSTVCGSCSPQGRVAVGTRKRIDGGAWRVVIYGIRQARACSAPPFSVRVGCRFTGEHANSCRVCAPAIGPVRTSWAHLAIELRIEAVGLCRVLIHGTPAGAMKGVPLRHITRGLITARCTSTAPAFRASNHTVPMSTAVPPYPIVIP